MKPDRAALCMSLVVMAAFGGTALAASEGAAKDLERGAFFTIDDYLTWLPKSKETTRIKDEVASTKTLERLRRVDPAPSGAKAARYEFESSCGISVTSRIQQSGNEADAEPVCKARIGSASAALAEEDLTLRPLPATLQGVTATMLYGVYQRDGEPVGNIVCARRAGRVVWIEFYGPGLLATESDLKKRLGEKIDGMLEVKLSE